MISAMRLFFTGLMLTVMMLGPAYPAQANDFDGNEKDTIVTQETVQQVEAYLKSLKTMRARFVQTTQDGTQVTGTFYLSRPGKMRFEYDPPLYDFIVADGLFIYYYDAEMKQQSNAPVSQSLADFFLRENIRMDGDVRVSDARRGRDLLQITLVQADDAGAGSLTLGLTENPMALKKWRVLDPQGSVTEIELFDVTTGINLKSALFQYLDPERKKPVYNR